MYERNELPVKVRYLFFVQNPVRVGKPESEIWSKPEFCSGVNGEPESETE